MAHIVNISPILSSPPAEAGSISANGLNVGNTVLAASPSTAAGSAPSAPSPPSAPSAAGGSSAGF